MFHKIDKIQNLVNSLLDLCSDAGAEVPSDSSSCDGREQKYEDLGVMILKAQDGDLSHRSMRELQRWMANDSQALRHYIDFQHLSVMLRFYFCPDAFRFKLPIEVSVSGAD